MLQTDPDAGDLAALARAARLSPSHLSRIFKAQTGVSISRFRNQQRLQRFLRALRQRAAHHGARRCPRGRLRQLCPVSPRLPRADRTKPVRAAHGLECRPPAGVSFRAAVLEGVCDRIPPPVRRHLNTSPPSPSWRRCCSSPRRRWAPLTSAAAWPTPSATGSASSAGTSAADGDARRAGLPPCPLRSDLTGGEGAVTAFVELGGKWTLTVVPRSDGSVAVTRVAAAREWPAGRGRAGVPGRSASRWASRVRCARGCWRRAVGCSRTRRPPGASSSTRRRTPSRMTAGRRRGNPWR